MYTCEKPGREGEPIPPPTHTHHGFTLSQPLSSPPVCYFLQPQERRGKALRPIRGTPSWCHRDMWLIDLTISCQRQIWGAWRYTTRPSTPQPVRELCQLRGACFHALCLENHPEEERVLQAGKRCRTYGGMCMGGVARVQGLPHTSPRLTLFTSGTKWYISAGWSAGYHGRTHMDDMIPWVGGTF